MAKLFKKKINWKKLVAVVGVSVIVLGCVGGLIALFGKQTETIGPGEFSVGDIGENGKPKDSTTAIYTKDAFACEGLQIIPDFEAKCEYQIFYYDAKDEFISCSDVMTGAYEGVNPDADRARIVIRPEAPEDLEDDEEFKIRFWEVRKYAKQLTITVNKDQLEYKTISVDLMNGKTLVNGIFTVADINELDSANTTVKATPLFTLDSVKYDFYRVYVKVTATSDTNVTVAFADAEKNEDGSVDAYKAIDGEFSYVLEGADMSIDTWYSITVKTPKGADAFRVMGPDTAEYRIYGMND